MEISVRELKSRLSAYLRRVAEGEEVVVTSRGKEVARLVPPSSRPRAASIEVELVRRLRSLPWIRPGKGKLRLPRIVARLKPGEKTLAEIVSEERG